MSDPTSFEQLMLEYINQARLDPQGEYDRFILSSDPVQAIDSDITMALKYFDVDLGLYQQQLQGLTAVAPLAWNSSLNDAATTHSELMVAQDQQSHHLSGEAGLGDRISSSGYDNWGYLSENIFAYSKSAIYGHAGFFIDWGNTPTGIQTPAGHRDNIMNGNLTEVGVGVVEDNSGATHVGPFVVTQDFGDRWDYQPQILGVIYDDNDSNDFYSIGEGSGGVTVVLTSATGGAAAVTSNDAGGYQLDGAPGWNTLTFSGSGLPANVSVEALFNDENIKVDLVDGETVRSSNDTTLGANAKNLVSLGTWATEGVGNELDNSMQGSPGNNTFWGGDGDDSMIGGNGNDWLQGNRGLDFITGGLGDDTLRGGKDQDIILGGEGDDDIYGGKGDDTLSGNNGDDFLLGAEGNDWLNGNPGNDRVFGGLGDDITGGGKGDDWVDGGDGTDVVRGGMGDDTLHGGTGEDILDGALGRDVLYGGADNDIFRFDAVSDSMPTNAMRDVIAGGFDNPGAGLGDLIDVSEIDMFSFIGEHDFSVVGQSQLRVEQAGSQVIVQGDLGGNGMVDFEIGIDNSLASTFSADDFIGVV